MNYYERHIGDYTKDTAHLSMLEHGAYNLLMDRYYATEEPIQDEQRYRLARARSEDEKAAVDAVLSEFFELVNGRWTQKRCDVVLADHHAFIEQQRLNGRSSAVKRALNRRSTTAAKNSTIVEPSLDSGTNRTSTGRQPPTPTPTPTPTPRSDTDPDARASSASAGEGNGSFEPSPAYELTERIKAIYPAGTYGASNWILAEREIWKLLDGGEDPEQLLAHARAFADQQLAKGSTGTQFVKSPEKFFGPDGHWRGPFPLPQASGPKSRRLKSATEIAEEYEARELASSGGSS